MANPYSSGNGAAELAWRQLGQPLRSVRETISENAVFGGLTTAKEVEQRVAQAASKTAGNERTTSAPMTMILHRKKRLGSWALKPIALKPRRQDGIDDHNQMQHCPIQRLNSWFGGIPHHLCQIARWQSKLLIPLFPICIGLGLIAITIDGLKISVHKAINFCEESEQILAIYREKKLHSQTEADVPAWKSRHFYLNSLALEAFVSFRRRCASLCANWQLEA
jgi:hypothetical protein